MSLPINQVLTGNCIEVMKTFPAESVDTIMFSPPYWGLRDYKLSACVFGGDVNCQHEWVEERSGLVHENRNFSKGTQEEVHGDKDTTFIKKYDDSKANFCVLCGAWRGSFGLEPHPQLFIDHMVLLCQLLKHVLKKEGSMFINLGDTYGTHGSGSKKHSHNFRKPEVATEEGIGTLYKPRLGFTENFVIEKQLLLIPSRVAIALQEDGWILRNDIIWNKPNAMPSSVKDRLTCSWEHIFHFVKSRKYYYDLDAIREPHKSSDNGKRKSHNSKFYTNSETKSPLLRHEGISLNILGKNPGDVLYSLSGRGVGTNVGEKGKAVDRKDQWRPQTRLLRLDGKNPGDVLQYDSKYEKTEYGQTLQGFIREQSIVKRRQQSREEAERLFPHDPKKQQEYINYIHDHDSHPDGKNPGDFWSINTKPFKGAHFAVYPEAICMNPIKASCPRWVCRKCGKPRIRITKVLKHYTQQWGQRRTKPWFNDEREMPQKVIYETAKETIGWSDCGCNNGFDSGIVLDPMCGSGTTLVVAKKLGRRWVGIDLNPAYIEMAKERLNKIPEKLTSFS